MCMLIFCKRLAESDITVTPSVKFTDWLHWWYHHAAHLVSSSTAALLFLTTAVRNVNLLHLVQSKWKLWKIISTEEKLDTISWLKKGWMKCYIYCNVRLAHIGILTICDNAGRIKERAWNIKEVFFCSKTTTIISKRTIPKMDDVSLLHIY